MLLDKIRRGYERLVREARKQGIRAVVDFETYLKIISKIKKKRLGK
jgi:hypothetical protein